MFGKRQFLINAEGKSCLIFPDARREIVEGMPSSTDAMLEIAIHEEGWVAVEVDGEDGVTEISLDLSCVSPDALVGAGNMLITQPIRKVHLRCFGHGWTEYEFSGNTEAAVGLLNAVHEGMDLVGRERFITHELDVRSLDPAQWEACDSLIRLFDLWQERNFIFDNSVFDFLRTHGLYDRSTLVEPNDDTLGGTFLFTGPGFNLYGKDWPRRTIGLPVTDQPDPVYGRWVGQTYERIFKSQSPEMMQVDAIIMSYPSHAPRRSYVCARLPWTAGGQQLILSASVLIN